jgi:hypothetical protein
MPAAQQAEPGTVSARKHNGNARDERAEAPWRADRQREQ